MLGRLAATVAKSVLQGNKVVVLRAELINMSGNFYRYDCSSFQYYVMKVVGPAVVVRGIVDLFEFEIGLQEQAEVFGFLKEAVQREPRPRTLPLPRPF